MKNNIVKINIENELDIVLAYKRAKQLAAFTGMNISGQTKFGTAVSEICRNVLEHVGRGFIAFNIVEQGRLYLEAQVTDRGRGIKNSDQYLIKKSVTINVKGCGIHNAFKLSDDFTIDSSPDKGTTVTIRKAIAINHPPLNNLIIQGWTDYFSKELSVSPYEEIKKQNMEYIELVETLRLKNLEAEDQIHEIKRLNNELDKFAYIVSHDLKAPLKNIEGIINMVLDSIDSTNEEAITGCEMLRGQAHKMEKFITDILSYSRAGKMSVQKTQVNLSALLTDIVYSLNIPESFHIIFEKELPTLYTEEIFLQQIFSNLISNAIKYHHKEKGTIRINMTDPANSNFYTFSVKDDGPGIEKNNQKRIFKIFESVTSREDSSGVGLAIVQNIVKEKEGIVWVESDGINGSEFFFTWPKEIIL